MFLSKNRDSILKILTDFSILLADISCSGQEAWMLCRYANMKDSLFHMLINVVGATTLGKRLGSSKLEEWNFIISKTWRDLTWSLLLSCFPPLPVINKLTSQQKKEFRLYYNKNYVSEQAREDTCLYYFKNSLRRWTTRQSADVHCYSSRKLMSCKASCKPGPLTYEGSRV